MPCSFTSRVQSDQLQNLGVAPEDRAFLRCISQDPEGEVGGKPHKLAVEVDVCKGAIPLSVSKLSMVSGYSQENCSRFVVNLHVPLAL